MTDRKPEAVYIISVAAEIAGMHPQTLRIYERRGLLRPFRTPGGTRRYSDEDLERLGLIQDLTAAGLNLEGVRRVLEMREEIARLEHQVSRLRRLLGEAQARLLGAELETTGRNLPDVPRAGFVG
ncbi:MAG: helix-turn-helix transcriptional regulator [Acidimicrobiia bacterium]